MIRIIAIAAALQCTAVLAQAQTTPGSACPTSKDCGDPANPDTGHRNVLVAQMQKADYPFKDADQFPQAQAAPCPAGKDADQRCGAAASAPAALPAQTAAPEDCGAWNPKNSAAVPCSPPQDVEESRPADPDQKPGNWAPIGDAEHRAESNVPALFDDFCSEEICPEPVRSAGDADADFELCPVPQSTRTEPARQPAKSGKSNAVSHVIPTDMGPGA